MKKTLFGLLTAAVVALTYFILFTPQGVHFYGEVLFPENETKDYAPKDYPTAITETKTARTIPLPAAVMQPSGIDYDVSNNRFFIVTDQAEIIELSGDFQTVASSVEMSNAPLFFRQGTIESNDFYQDHLYVSGDLGEIELWTKDGAEWKQAGKVEISSPSEIESEGMAINPANGDLYMGDGSTIQVVDEAGYYKKTLALKAEAKPGRSLSEYIIAGMDFHDGLLYIVTEYHSAILAVDPETGEIQNIYALKGITEGAGLAVTNDAFYIVVDHELNEPSPGIHVYPR